MPDSRLPKKLVYQLKRKVFLSIEENSAVMNTGDTSSNKQKFFELHATLKAEIFVVTNFRS